MLVFGTILAMYCASFESENEGQYDQTFVDWKETLKLLLRAQNFGGYVCLEPPQCAIQSGHIHI